MPTTPSEGTPPLMRVVIADDEPLARERLRRLLALESDVEVVAECSDGGSALEQIRRTLPDAVFLDVRMPVMDGFSVLERLAGQEPAGVVFVTAHDGYALKAFEASAVDYLLKPFDKERFQVAMQKLRSKLGSANVPSAPVGARPGPDEAVATAQAGRLAIRSGRSVAVVQLGEIAWIKGAGNYAELHAGKKTHLLRRTLSKLEQELPPGEFIRISRSHIVNLRHVREVRAKSHGDFQVVLADGELLNGSRNHRGFLHLAGVKGRKNDSSGGWFSPGEPAVHPVLPSAIGQIA